MRLATRLLISSTVLGCAGLAFAQSNGFYDISRIDRSEIELRKAPEPPAIVREPESWIEPDSAPSSPDPTLGRPLVILALDADEILSIPAPRSSRPPSSARAVEFTMAGRAIDMLVIEARPDPDFDAAHMTLIASDSEDYARLSISHSGPEIVGTVIIDSDRYRILPDATNPEFQLVYPVALHGTGWKRENPPDLDARAGQLEARHLQMAWVAEVQPTSFITRADGRPQVYRGSVSLGVLDFWDSLNFDPAGNGTVDSSLLKLETERFLNDNQRFTWIYDRIEVELEPEFETDLVTLSSNGFNLVLFQTIHGIPISRTLQLNMGPTGEVTGFNGILMREDMAETSYGARIPLEEARATSLSALINEHGIETDGDFLEETLVYNVVSDNELDLLWQMSLRADCGMIFSFDIDAITGQVRQINGRPAGDAANQTRSRFARQFSEDIFFQCRFMGPR